MQWQKKAIHHSTNVGYRPRIGEFELRGVSLDIITIPYHLLAKTIIILPSGKAQ